MQRVTIGSTRYRTFYLSLTWIGHNETFYHNFNVFLTHCHAFALNIALFAAIRNALPRVTVKFINIYIY